MKVEKFAPADITVREGLRPLDAAAVARLAESIASIGLQTPVTARWVHDGEGDDLVLVAGRHRLAAVKSAGLQTIDCVIVSMDDADARLWEIAENLHRAELTVQERADHIAEWVRLTSEKASGASCATKPGAGRHSEGGLRAAVRELGIDRTEAQRAVKIASIEPEAKEAAAEAGITTQSALLRVAAEPSAERQLARIRSEQEKAAERERASKEARKADRDIVYTEAHRCAEWLKGRLDLDEIRRLAEWVVMLKPAELSAALLRDEAAPVFDSTRAGGQ